jgi:hypothetical protein
MPNLHIPRGGLGRLFSCAWYYIVSISELHCVAYLVAEIKERGARKLSAVLFVQD